jgi:signal transduction histidine kinase
VGTVVSRQASQERLPFRERRWPVVLFLAVCVGLAAAITASGKPSLPLPVVLVWVAAYLVASRLPRRLSVRAVAAAAAALGGALCYAAVATTSNSLPVAVVEIYLPLAAAWLIGDAVAARQRYLAGLAAQAERERASEAERARQEVREERVRIARELHDVVAHALAVVTVQAGVGRRLMAQRPAEASTALETIETIGRTAQEELRVVLGLLREEGISDEQLAPAPRLADLKQLAETVRASGTPVELRVPDDTGELSPALQLTVYRVVQEALTNVVKHAPRSRATAEVTFSDGGIRIEVANGSGPARQPAGQGAAPGHGIAGMRERIGAFGGSLSAGPSPGGGYTVLAEIPVEGAT